jgi:uncharacterized protein YhdP
MTFDVDTLRAAGYESGDVLILATSGPAANRDLETTNQSYQQFSTTSNLKTVRNNIAPPDAEVVVAVSATSGNKFFNTELRVRDTIQNDVALNTFAPNDSEYMTQFSTWLTTNPSSLSKLQIEIRSRNGNIAKAFAPQLHVGVRLP